MSHKFCFIQNLYKVVVLGFLKLPFGNYLEWAKKGKDLTIEQLAMVVAWQKGSHIHEGSGESEATKRHCGDSPRKNDQRGSVETAKCGNSKAYRTTFLDQTPLITESR